MFYNSLKSATCPLWKRILKAGTNEKIILKEENSIDVGSSKKKFNDVKSCEFYKQLISKTYVRASALNTWEEELYYVNFPWDEIYQIPYKCSIETSLQSLQYQILNRYLPCNLMLFRWGKRDNLNCNICTTHDDILHYFYHCPQILTFWSQFKAWWKMFFYSVVDFGALDVVFGLLNPLNDDVINALNYSILFAKQFIHRNKFEGNDITLTSFTNCLLNKLKTIHHIAIKQNKETTFNKQLHPLLNLLDRK